jgi:hypothetical protein
MTETITRILTVCGADNYNVSQQQSHRMWHEPADNEPALSLKVVKLTDDMLEFAEEPKNAVILDENGEPLKAGDHDRRYFEGQWMLRYKGKYYLSYSTGNTHFLCYAIGDNPYEPFTCKGVILTPVVGWTTHHSICEVKGKWYLFYHTSVPSGGKTWLRSIKIRELFTITMEPLFTWTEWSSKV